MKRKKWTEEEEQTLIQSYSLLLLSSSSSSSTSTATITTTTPQNPSPSPSVLQCCSRQKKFQPVADRVNSLHHLLRPSSFPHLWSWRDVSVKIHNMRHQYLHVKNKLKPSSSFDPARALSLWPNFLLYRDVFGDAPETRNHPRRPNIDSSSDDEGDDDASEEEEEEDERRKGRWRRRKKWRRAEEEERREAAEMEWIEKLLGMQMEHERQAMQMHSDACQAQLQVLGVLVRVLCQSLGAHAANGSPNNQPAAPAENSPQLQQRMEEEAEEEEEEETTESLVGD